MPSTFANSSASRATGTPEARDLSRPVIFDEEIVINP
jgi:hypothetical protein